MTPLFIKSDETFARIAEILHSYVLSDFHYEERDGLNLGGGDYYMFRQGKTQIVLVSNDEDHADLYCPERAEYHYFCYVHRGDEFILEQVKRKLRQNNIDCDILSME